MTYLDAEFPIFWDRAAGTNVWDTDGNRFLDLTSAFAVASLGHGAPAVVAALTSQASRLMHAMGDVHPTEAKVRLCEELGEVTFGRWTGESGKVILGSAGFEAVEAALKTAFLATGRRGVIAFTGGYHGLGYGALEVCGLPHFQRPFRPQLADFATILPYPDCRSCPLGRKPNSLGACVCLEEIEARIRAALASGGIGAVLVEPAQGRGGEVFPPDPFLPMLRRACDAHGALLVLDEIYTGFHRTGPWFASEHTGVIPDLICVGKALTNGFPLSACIGRRAVMDAWPESDGEALHTSTFLGHPIGCTVALASLAEHHSVDLQEEVERKGAALRAALRGGDSPSPWAGDVRGRGLMIGAEIVDRAGRPDGPRAIRAVKRALRDGVLLLSGGPGANVLSFTPPFVLDDSEISFVGAQFPLWLAD